MTAEHANSKYDVHPITCTVQLTVNYYNILIATYSTGV